MRFFHNVVLAIRIRHNVNLLHKTTDEDERNSRLSKLDMLVSQFNPRKSYQIVQFSKVKQLSEEKEIKSVGESELSQYPPLEDTSTADDDDAPPEYTLSPAEKVSFFVQMRLNPSRENIQKALCSGIEYQILYVIQSLSKDEIVDLIKESDNMEGLILFLNLDNSSRGVYKDVPLEKKLALLEGLLESGKISSLEEQEGLCAAFMHNVEEQLPRDPVEKIKYVAIKNTFPPLLTRIVLDDAVDRVEDARLAQFGRGMSSRDFAKLLEKLVIKMDANLYRFPSIEESNFSRQFLGPLYYSYPELFKEAQKHSTVLQNASFLFNENVGS